MPLKYAQRAKSKPCGNAGSGGGRNIASAETHSPGATAAKALSLRMVRRRRVGRSTALLPMAVGAMTMRARLLASGEMVSIRPSTISGPLSRSMTGAAMASARNFANAKPSPPAAISMQRKRRKTPFKFRDTNALANPASAIAPASHSGGSDASEK